MDGYDGSFTGLNLSYILLTFSGADAAVQLDTSKKYGIFLSLAGNTTGFTTSGVAIRANSADLYSGGIGYRENPTNTLATLSGDAAFIVDATPVPFEFEASGGVAILGGLFLANKFKNRKQNEKA